MMGNAMELDRQTWLEKIKLDLELAWLELGWGTSKLVTDKSRRRQCNSQGMVEKPHLTEQV